MTVTTSTVNFINTHSGAKKALMTIGRGIHFFYRSYVPGITCDSHLLSQKSRIGDNLWVDGDSIKNSAGELLVQNKFLCHWLEIRGKTKLIVSEQMTIPKGMLRLKKNSVSNSVSN